MDFTIKINVNESRRLDRPRAIFKFRGQAHVLPTIVKELMRY